MEEHVNGDIGVASFGKYSLLFTIIASGKSSWCQATPEVAGQAVVGLFTGQMSSPIPGLSLDQSTKGFFPEPGALEDLIQVLAQPTLSPPDDKFVGHKGR